MLRCCVSSKSAYSKYTTTSARRQKLNHNQKSTPAQQTNNQELEAINIERPLSYVRAHSAALLFNTMHITPLSHNKLNHSQPIHVISIGNWQPQIHIGASLVVSDGKFVLLAVRQNNLMFCPEPWLKAEGTSVWTTLLPRLPRDVNSLKHGRNYPIC